MAAESSSSSPGHSPKSRSTKRADEVYDITGADTSLTEDQSHRMKVYTIQMVIRTVCFVAAVFAPGIWRWVLFIGAIFLPYFAVVMANNTRVVSTTTVNSPGTSGRELTSGTMTPGSGPVIHGRILEPGTSDDADAEIGVNNDSTRRAQ